MHASVVDLRKKMKDISKALARNEEVTIFNHGKVIGTIIPANLKQPSKKRIQDHPFLGMSVNKKEKVEDIMKRLREGRFNAL